MLILIDFCLYVLCIINVHAQLVPAAGRDALAPIVHEVFILEPIPMQNALGKSDLKLECVVSGYPLPVVEWSFNNVKFVKDKPFSGIEGDPVRHTIIGNRIIIKNVKGKLFNKPEEHDTGRYRCIATNEVGSVFLEKQINIHVMGYFTKNNNYIKDKPPEKVNVVIGRNVKIPCPDHVAGYGTTYSWGRVTTENSNMVIITYYPGQINDHMFYTLEGLLVYSVVTDSDERSSRSIGGLSCLLSNGNEVAASIPQMLYKYDTTKQPERYPPVLVAELPKVMFASINTAYTMTCGATGLPPPKITWEYQGYEVKSRYNNSKELNFEFFQIVGNGMQLKIQRVTQYSGGTFRCYANSETGEVFSIGQLKVQKPTKWLKRFPGEINLSLEGKLSLICNATGSPLPIFEWFQNSTVLALVDNRKVVEHDTKYGGSRLIIHKANYDDNGIYICVAINPLDTLTMSTFVRVQDKKPEFNIPVQDPIYLFRASKMLIHCLATGGPLPEKVWSKDGKVIVSEGRFKVLKDGALEINGVADSDAGEYTCTATNANGKATSKGVALVLNATIITNPPQNLIFDVGWPYAALFCGASWDSRLDLRIEWYKGGVLMTKFDDRIFMEKRVMGPPRILYLRNLTIDDGGNYSCHAYTKVGDAISEQRKVALLSIKGPPEPPSGVQIKSGNCANFQIVLQWSRGEELSVKTHAFYIEFSTNISSHYNDWFGGEGDPLIPNSKIEVTPGEKVEFPLDRRHLVPGANLIFRIKASSLLLMGRPSRPSPPDTCVTPPGKPVLNPINVTGFTNTTGNLFMKWRPVTDVYFGAPGFYYKLGYKAADAPTFIVREIKDVNQSMFEITKSEPNKAYEFYIQSINEKGAGPEPVIYKAVSGKEPPTSAPSNFRVKFVNRFSVELGWNKVKDSDGYRVTYWNTSNSEHLRGRAKRSLNPMITEYQYFMGSEFDTGASLGNITAQINFVATVSAVTNGGGAGPESSVIRFQTAPRVPRRPVKVDFQVYGQSAHLSWNPPFQPNGYIERYDISWIASDNLEQNAVQRQEGGSQSMDRRSREAYMIDIFSPLTYYNIRLSARNRVGPGEDWEKVKVAVSVPDAPGKPDAPKATFFDDSSINITFQRPNYGGLPTKFFVYYRPSGRYYEEPKIVSQTFPKRAWILVTGLEFLVYDFWTVGYSPLGVSETSDVTEQQPARRSKPQAHASDFPWWRSNWFVAVGLCLLFLFIMVVTVAMLLRKGPITYKSFKNEAGYTDVGFSGNYKNKNGQQMQPLIQSQAPINVDNAGYPVMAGAASYDDRRNVSASEVPSDAPPPRYSSQSSLEKKRYDDDETGSEDGSRTGSDYSRSETGSETESGSGSETGSDYSDEDGGSYYSDEEKKRDSGSADEEEDDGTFV